MTLRGVFGLPPGLDFPQALVQGLCARMAGQPPEAMARVTLILNTARMRRRVSEAFHSRGATLLPRLRLITDLPDDPRLGLPPAGSALRRRLVLARLVARLLDAQPDLAPRSAIYDLADSLARLADEMQAENVPLSALLALDVSDHSAHWARVQHFLGIIADQLSDAAEPQGHLRQRRAVERLLRLWEHTPTPDPVILAGSSGSRGSTAELMLGIARLPQGALVLPGLDFDMPATAWDALDDALTAEDHPQFRYRRLADRLGLPPTAIARWTDQPAPDPNRNRLISLALRPAPVTDRWLAEGPSLPNLLPATETLSLIEAPDPRAEAEAVALVLREAVERGETAALVTPDRNLTRRVAAALDRWGIRPDDSAGQPLGQSPPGRFLRHVADLFAEPLTADRLLILLKHPLTASGGDRGLHLRLSRELELRLRRQGPAHPRPDDLLHWAATLDAAEARPWAQALSTALSQPQPPGPQPLAVHVARHRATAEALARGLAADGNGTLWAEAAGLAALGLMDELQAEADWGGPMTARDYRDLLRALMARIEVRETVQTDPRVLFWGTAEARVQGADLVVLGGLTDGIWPRLPDPDPWLNRRMRKSAGLLLPERQIGLSAHDFQQAIGAPRVVLTRARRNAEAETIPSRWLNRLVNLMGGLSSQNGPQALAAMRARGADWLALAAAQAAPDPGLTADPGLRPAPRPAPRPPVADRPRRLSLTRIARLIRDPYDIYARDILRLKPLDPLHPTVDHRDRGTAFHLILESFVRDRPEDETPEAAAARLSSIAARVLADQIPFPAIRLQWLTRFEAAAAGILRQDRRLHSQTLALETRGELRLPDHDFLLYGTPDRIERLADGRLHLIDYKSGTPPTEKQQKSYEKQLLLASVMAEHGGFAAIGPTEVAQITYLGLTRADKPVETVLTPEALRQEWARFRQLIARYFDPQTGYAARRALFEDRLRGDYDHLSRYGEWQMTDRATPIPVGPRPEGAA